MEIQDFKKKYGVTGLSDLVDDFIGKISDPEYDGDISSDQKELNKALTDLENVLSKIENKKAIIE